MRFLLSLLLILQTTFAHAAAYNDWQSQTTAISHIIGGFTGYIASGGEGANVSAAATIAQSGFENNYLTHHQQWGDYLERLAECAEGDVACRTEVHRWAENLSLENEHRFLMCRQNGNCAEIVAEIQAARDYEEQYSQGSELVQHLQDQAYYNSVGNIRPTAYGHRDTGYTGEDVIYADFHSEHCGGISTADCVRAFEITVEIRKMGDVQTQLGAISTLGSAVALAATGCGGVVGCVILGGGTAMSADQLETGLDNITAINEVEHTNYIQALMAAGLDQSTAETIEMWTGVGLAAGDVALVAAAGIRNGGVLGDIGNSGANGAFDPSINIGATNTADNTVEVFEPGANITPNSTLENYPTIGANGTFVTEVESIENVIGPIPDGATSITISPQQAADLESALGLNPGSLESSNTLSIVENIAGCNPRCPVSGNDHFLGGGQGLPDGGSELVIDSIPSTGGDGITQITVNVE